MGIIVRQSIPNTIIHFLGIVVGYINTVLIFPNVFEPDQFGLTRLLVSLSVVYMNLSSFGVNQINIKFIGFFRKLNSKKNGFVFLGIIIMLTGFLLMTILYVVFKNNIIEYYSKDNDLFVEKYFLVIPFSLFFLFNCYFESYLQGIYKTVFANFVTNLLTRILWLVAISLYHYNCFSFDWFLIAFISVYFINSVILFIYLIARKEINFMPNWSLYRKLILKRVLNFGFFQSVNSISTIALNTLDKILIAFILDLSEIAVYSIVVYFGSLILTPTTQIMKIFVPMVNKEIRSKNIKGLEELYMKSSLNSIILGGFIFLCLYLNINEIYLMLPEKYQSGANLFVYIGIANLLNITFGINGPIINMSKYYKFNSLLSIILLIMSFTLNYILINIYGMKGAVLATLISIVCVNLIKLIFIYVKLKIQPFIFKSVMIYLIIGSVYYLVHLIPIFLDNEVVMLLFRLLIITILYFALTIGLKISEDVNNIYLNFINFIKKKMLS